MSTPGNRVQNLTNMLFIYVYVMLKKKDLHYEHKREREN